MQCHKLTYFSYSDMGSTASYSLDLLMLNPGVLTQTCFIEYVVYFSVSVDLVINLHIYAINIIKCERS